MAKRLRRIHGAEFKARVALAAIRGDKTLSELSEQFEVHSTQVAEWKRQLLERAGDVFSGPSRNEARVDHALHRLLQQPAAASCAPGPNARCDILRAANDESGSMIEIGLPTASRGCMREKRRTRAVVDNPQPGLS